jgi:Co/Zn/Cd efflux system component
MSANCPSCEASQRVGHAPPPGYRRVLWIALLVNALMFGVEIVGGLTSGSVSLLADAIDFFGDAANYGITLAVLGLGLAWRSRAALLKAASMMGFGVFVLGRTAWSMSQGVAPEPLTMGVIGGLALAANLGVAALLYAFRDGDANMRGVWLCTRNDAIGNVTVMLAALGVFGTGTAWPDLAVASVMAGLAISAGWTVMSHARRELALGPVG